MGSGPVPEQPAVTPPPRRRCRRRLVCLGVLGALVVVVYLLHLLLLPRAAAWLDVSEPPTEVDDVMVLGGESSVRPFVAAALYNKGLAKRVLIPTIKRGPEAEDGILPAESDVIYQVLRKRGVPDEAIVRLPGEVNSTADEAAALGHYLDDHPDDRVTVVTTCYHTRRVRWIFRKQLGARADHVHFVGGPTDGYDTSNWWRSEEGTRQYVNEFVKLPFYIVNY